MEIIFRTLGPWGAGKGANLQPAEVDSNFWSVAQAIVDLQNNPAQAVGIASIGVSGTQMTITLTDGTVLGPYTLPVLTFRWRGEWAPSTSYAQLDVVTITNVGIYMVQIAHTSGATFDPGLLIGGLPAFLMLFGSSDASLSTLPDVLIADLADNDILRWSASVEKWRNIPLGTLAYQDDWDVDITGGTITGMPTPVDPSDVATKAYVDSLPLGSSTANGTMMSNISGAIAPAIPNTLSNFLDYVLNTTIRGTLIYRGASGWQALVPGTSGYFLRTSGPGQDLSWQVGGSGVTSITAGAGLTASPSPIVATGTLALAPVADRTLLANVSGGSAAPVPLTLSAILDVVLGNARGSLLSRTTGGWVALAPGAVGQYLKAQGAGADLAWDSPAGAGTVTSVSAGIGISTGGGPITGSGTVSLAAIADDTLLANTSGSSAAPIATTLPVLLDSVFGATQGTVVYRSGTTWAALSPGTSGQVLTTAGAAANPSWANAAAGAPIANLAMLANISGATAAATGLSVSAVLDAVFSSARGAVLYRDATGWAALGPGTSGQVLTTGGAAANPSWATVTSGSGGGGDISGMSAGQIPIAAGPSTIAASGNLSGDVSTADSLVTTLATVNANTGTFQGLTLDGKGRVTAASNQAYLTQANAATIYAPINNPIFTGDPRSVTPALSDSDVSIATTAFVKGQNYLTGNQTITLSGDLSGSGATAISATVTQLQGRPVAATAPTGSQVLQWNGSAWTPTTLGAGTGTITGVTAGNGLSGGGTTGTVTLDLSAPVSIANGGTSAVTAPAALTALGALPIAGGTMTGKITAIASANGGTGLTLPHGTNPLTSVNGDLWTTTTGLFARINGTTIQAAPLTSPVFAGTPQLPTGTTGVTQAASTSNTTLATTAYVKSNLPVPLTVALGGTGATTFPVGASAGTAYAMVRNLLTGATTGAAASDPTWGTYGTSDGGLAGAMCSATVYPYIEMSRALGSAGTPAALAVDSYLGVIQWDGHANGAWQYARASVAVRAGEAWTASAQGTRYEFNNTSPGTITSKVEMGIYNGVIIGTPTGSFKGNGVLNAVGVQANGVALTSDARLKRDIADMPACLPLVQAVEPKAYRWRPLETPEGGPEDFAERRRWGFIAQDVEAAAKSTDIDFAGIEGGEELGLDAGALIACLWSAVRELSQEVAELKSLPRAKAGGRSR